MALLFIPLDVATVAPTTAAAKTGREIVTSALRWIQAVSPVDAPEGEALEDGLSVATDLIDSWRLERLLVSGVTRTTYPLTIGKQAYTIGLNADFNQTYPVTIDRWSVVPDRAAATPWELDRGRPYTAEAWQQIRGKTQTSPQPTVLYYDRQYVAGWGTCWIYPIPTVSTADVVLYERVPALTTLVADTTYNLKPGMMRALTLNLALELVDRYGKAATATDRLERRAASALALVKRANIRPTPSPIRPEFIIGERAGRRTHNIYQGE